MKRKQPFPDDPAERAVSARAIAKGTAAPARLIERAAKMPPAERLRYVWHAGVKCGALIALAAMKCRQRLPRRRSLDADSAQAWAAGLADGATPPPKAAFGRGRRPAVIQGMYRAALERGMLLALDALEPQRGKR